MAGPLMIGLTWQVLAIKLEADVPSTGYQLDPEIAPLMCQVEVSERDALR
jgi:hypothetical protein